MTERWGITYPFDGIPLPEQRALVERLPDLGYTDAWSMESNGTDAFTPLALASVWAPSLRLGTAIVPAYTRGPATLAMCVATMAAAAPGRFVLGLGSSSNVIVEKWNAMRFDAPYRRVRDTLAFLDAAMSGEKVSATYDTFAVDGFRLGVQVPQRPPVLVAALREGMLRLAGREAQGAILNWLSPDDVRTVVPYVTEGAGGQEREIAARIFVIPTADADTARAIGRFMLGAYLSVGVYRAFHEWLGRTDELAEFWRLWGEGDRKGASAAIPDHVVDELVVHGAPGVCKEKVEAYVEAGVTTPVLAVVASGGDVAPAVEALGR